MTNPPTIRKMRRSREAQALSSDHKSSTTTSGGGSSSLPYSSSSGYDLFAVHGDAMAALQVFRNQSNDTSDAPSFAMRYNCWLLEQLTKSINNHNNNNSSIDNSSCCSEQVNMFLDEMLQREEEFTTESSNNDDDDDDTAIHHLLVSSTHKKKRNELILAYNRALVYQAVGQNYRCAMICVEKIAAYVHHREIPTNEVAKVASRMGLLLLDCILTLAVGKAGLQFAIQILENETVDENGKDDNNTTILESTMKIPPVNDIIAWLELVKMEKDPQLKFLLQVYKSRVALADLDSNGNVTDSNIRSARKDMKVAMELFQNKLRPQFGADTASVVSSANSEELSSAGNSKIPNEQQPPPPSSVVLQKLNQSALCLKAHLEQLKGNTKKSLILCGEALTATTHRDDTTAYEALHCNNLAVVYETNNRRHLALHALSKSLRGTSNQLFLTDGTIRADPTLPILCNAALCALRARKFLSAYECMAACLIRSTTYWRRPRCWLRLAEACLGIFADLRNRTTGKTFSTIEDSMFNEPLGIIVDNGLFSDNVGVQREELVETLGSPLDMEQVQRNPLLRARVALEHVIQEQHMDQLEADTLTSAQLALSYVYLAFAEHRIALVMAKLVLENVKRRTEHDPDASQSIQRIRRRQAATARMYAAEASCVLGDQTAAMKFLVGDGRSDTFERMAADLSGVTMETASSNDQCKRCLAKAQAMVRASAGTITAAMNNPAAKQLVNSAAAMEEAYLVNRERSSARRALIYTLLREGNHSTALSLLVSLR